MADDTAPDRPNDDGDAAAERPAAKKLVARKVVPGEARTTDPAAPTDGEDAPEQPKKAASKRASAKKAAPKKATTAKKSSAKKASAKKTSSTKKASTAKKASTGTKKAATAKKSSAKKASGTKKAATAKKASSAKASGDEKAANETASPAKKAPAKKATAKRAPAEKATTRKASTKKATAKKASAKRAPAAKKATAKKAAAKRAATTRKASTGKAAPATAAAASRQPSQVRTLAGGMPDPSALDRPWLGSYPPGVPSSYDYPPVPLTRFLDDAAKDFPETEAVHFLGYSLTYRQLLDKVDRFAAALQALGVRKGDRVGVILPNCPQHVVAIFAVLRIGAVVAETNPLYTEAELEHQLNDAGCKVVVCLDPIYAKLATLKGKLPTVEHIIATGIQDALPFPKNVLFPIKGKKDGTYAKIPDGEGVLRMSELISRTAPTATQVPIDPATDLAVLLYTGGTTGVSKGVMLTHGNLVANAFQGRLWLPDVQAGRENMLCVLPFFHAYGFTICLTVGLLSAATLTLLPRFEVDTVLKTIDKRKPTLFPGVPTIYVALNQADDVKKHDLSSIRACLSGAAPLPVEVARRFEELTGGKLREGYGLTETSPITHANPIYGRAKKGSIGLPITDTVCTLVDLEDPTRPAAPGEPGELAVAGPQVMAGYWNRPEETAAVLRDGWLLTGDIATIDDEGYVAVIDRKKDLIIAGGYNVYPRDVEEVLYRHPKVAKAVVAGIPDEYRGETVKAYIVLREGERATEAEMDEFLRGELAAYKVPKAYEFRGSLPETMVGKVLRRELVAEELARRDR